jgi:hypothetical protein
MRAPGEWISLLTLAAGMDGVHLGEDDCREIAAALRHGLLALEGLRAITNSGCWVSASADGCEACAAADRARPYSAT